MAASFKSQFIVVCLLVLGGCTRKTRPGEATVVLQIRQLHELATVRYSLQRVVGIREPKVPLGEEALLLMVEGRVTAGVDLAALTPNQVRFTDNGSALVELPQAKVFDASLDEKKTRVWDRHVTWWTPWVPFNPDLEHKARLQALDEMQKAALQMGILEQAQRNAETAIRDLLNLVGVATTFRKLPS